MTSSNTSSWATRGPRRVVVVGGGITGLTAAYRLTREASPCEVTLLESRSRLGGNIQTERRDGFVIDAGPDAFVVSKPQALALCKELGLESRLIPTTARNRKVYIERNGLHALPEGLVLTIPTRIWPLVRTPLFSFRAKLRMGLDLFLPKEPAYGSESIARFIRRRLGREALERLAEPLLGGIYAGDVEALDMRATFPELVEMEQRHGSLIRGALAARDRRQAAARASAQHAEKSDKTPPSPFLSLTGGMGELVDALVAALAQRKCDVRVGTSLESVVATKESGARFEVRARQADGTLTTLLADDLVMTTPAHVSGPALATLDEELASRLGLVTYVSTATVVLAFPRADVPHSLDAVGVICPKSAGRRILAATFISSKWVGRAPEGMALLRVFVGGHRDPEVLEKTDEELVALAREELEAIVGVRARPLLSRVFRFDRANPQPLVGHTERLLRLKMIASRHQGLYLAGAGFDGVGIPDCIRQATDVAARIESQERTHTMRETGSASSYESLRAQR